MDHFDCAGCCSSSLGDGGQSDFHHVDLHSRFSGGQWLTPKKPARKGKVENEGNKFGHATRFDFLGAHLDSDSSLAAPGKTGKSIKTDCLQKHAVNEAKKTRKWRKLAVEFPLTDAWRSKEPVLAPLTIEEEVQRVQQDTPVHTLPWKEIGRKHSKVKTVVDSGAADTVGPPSMAPHLRVQPSAGSMRGQHYVSASKQRLPNLGQQTLNAITDD